jgi:hypothetical protein
VVDFSNLSVPKKQAMHACQFSHRPF